MMRDSTRLNNSDFGHNLDDMNDEETLQRMPAILYMSVAMVVGSFGNAVVIYVYYIHLKRRKGAHWTFIRCMALTDLCICLIVIPFELYQQTHQLTFYSDIGCRVGRGITVFLSVLSCFLLILMSIDRFRRVCQPFTRQLTTRQAIGNVCLAWVFSAFFAWPEALLSGISVAQSPNNFTGHDCSFADRFQDTNYTVIYSLCLCFIYFISMSILIIVYAIIAREIFQRRKGIKATEQLQNIGSISNVKPVTSQQVQSKRVLKKVTKIALLISICFILSYIPYSIIKLNASILKGRFVSNSVTKAVYPILGRFYILNKVVNPIIYLCVDLTFRKECKELLNRTTCRHLGARTS